MASRGSFLGKFLSQGSPTTPRFTASQFCEIWSHFDADGNGYIEGSELDDFLREFLSVVATEDTGMAPIEDSTLEAIKKEFMAEFDENSDNKIEMTELAKILPTDETFLLLFRKDSPIESSVDFMKIWRRFDKDHSGYIEADELKEFLSYLLRESLSEYGGPADEKIIEYTTTMLELFDQNKDGKLQLSEMSRLLPVRENFLCRPIFKNAHNIMPHDIDRIFCLYDQDSNGEIEDCELQGFLKDLLELAQEDYDEDDMDFFKQVILDQWDVNHDGKISKDELKMLLLQQSKLAAEESAHNKKSKNSKKNKAVTAKHKKK